MRAGGARSRRRGTTRGRAAPQASLETLPKIPKFPNSACRAGPRLLRAPEVLSARCYMAPGRLQGNAPCLSPAALPLPVTPAFPAPVPGPAAGTRPCPHAFRPWLRPCQVAQRGTRITAFLGHQGHSVPHAEIFFSQHSNTVIQYASNNGRNQKLLSVRPSHIPSCLQILEQLYLKQMVN